MQRNDRAPAPQCKAILGLYRLVPSRAKVVVSEVHRSPKSRDAYGDRENIRLESRPVAYFSFALLACYAFLLGALWRGGYTLFGTGYVPNSDFSMFWAAARLAATGTPAVVYDAARLGAFKGGGPSAFFYPPWLLIALLPLGQLPFATAAGLWLSVTLASYLAGICAILRSGTALLAALAAPAVLLNVLPGQGGLLAAGLLGAGLALIDTAPIAAGVLIGLLSYKPQFGVLLPLFLVITHRWRAFASAVVTVITICTAAGLLFGWETFVAFAKAVHGFDIQGHPEDLLASPYGLLLRGLGMPNAAAWSAYAVIAAASAAAALWLATSGARPDIKSAAIATASVVVTPYSNYYDLPLLSVPIALLVRDGLRTSIGRTEAGALGVALLLPIEYVLMPQQPVYLPGPAMCTILAAVIGWRAFLSVTASGRSKSA